MYKIIGSDQKEYGPVTAEQLRQWITTGRANLQTKAQPEGGTDWRPLAEFPEFAGAAAAPGLPPLTGQAVIDKEQMLKNRGSNKLAAGICGILIGGLGVHKFVLGYTTEGVIMLLVTVLSCGIAGIVTGIIGLIEGIIYLTKTDEEFVRIYVDGRKGWF
ncbi:MAG: NINE protein [Pedosphaera sp.]|nr:NINE protein [Pedosphaera sp.]